MLPSCLDPPKFGQNSPGLTSYWFNDLWLGPAPCPRLTVCSQDQDGFISGPKYSGSSQHEWWGHLAPEPHGMAGSGRHLPPKRCCFWPRRRDTRQVSEHWWPLLRFLSLLSLHPYVSKQSSCTPHVSLRLSLYACFFFIKCKLLDTYFQSPFSSGLNFCSLAHFHLFSTMSKIVPQETFDSI